MSPVKCLWANISDPEEIKLSNNRSYPTVPFQILPNTQKFGVYDSTACEGCSINTSTLFLAGEFREGQADQLIKAIENTTGLKVPDGVDAIARLNALIKDQNFGIEMLDMKENNDLSSSLEFSVGEFNGSISLDALIEALQSKSRINFPVTKTSIQSLNKLLEDKNLYRVIRTRSDPIEECLPVLQQAQPLSPLETKDFNRCLVEANVIKDFTSRLQQGQQLSLLQTKVLNRFLIEKNYPLETPKVQDALTIVKSMRDLSFRNYLSPEEIRSMVKTIFPQETPETFDEKYLRVQHALPISVQNTVHVTNHHVFPKDGTNIHFAFSNDHKMYYGIHALSDYKPIAF